MKNIRQNEKDRRSRRRPRQMRENQPLIPFIVSLCLLPHFHLQRATITKLVGTYFYKTIFSQCLLSLSFSISFCMDALPTINPTVPSSLRHWSSCFMKVKNKSNAVKVVWFQVSFFFHAFQKMSPLFSWFSRTFRPVDVLALGDFNLFFKTFCRYPGFDVDSEIWSPLCPDDLLWFLPFYGFALRKYGLPC